MFIFEISNHIIVAISLEVIEAALVKHRQVIGILGMIFAVLGGVAWYIQQNIIAIILWGAAGLILLKLNNRNRKMRRYKNK
jgi:Flp pilus assembly protein TadB